MHAAQIIVVGGGPAGMMAALSARMHGADVVLLEQNSTLGKKLLLTGNGRCNFTNSCDINFFAEHFFHGGEFLRDAFRRFSNQDIIRFLKTCGVASKIEENGCVFPATDSAESVLAALQKSLQKNKVRIIYNTAVQEIQASHGEVKGVIAKNEKIFPCRNVILATGGISYPQTGSDGVGLKIAARLGHTITPLRPGLISLIVGANPRLRREANGRSPLLEGLTVRNVELEFKAPHKKNVSVRGDILFTRDGISGPAVLSQSSRIVQWLSDSHDVYVLIDFFPDTPGEALKERIIRERQVHPKQTIKNVLTSLLSNRLAQVLVKTKNIDQHKRISHITRNELRLIVDLLKGLRLDIIRPGPIEKAMITQGGVSLKEVSPRTMESRLVRGLYFAGEMLDIDAESGGFNLQAAFSTGWCAGTNTGDTRQ